MNRNDEETKILSGTEPKKKTWPACLSEILFYAALVAAALAFVSLATGCALIRLPGNVEAIRDAAENVKADADALADDLTTNPATKQKLAEERKRLDETRAARDSKDAESMNWFLALAGSLFGLQGGVTWMSILTAVFGFYRASQEKKKKEASMDAVDIQKDAFDTLAKVAGVGNADQIKEQAKIKMVQKAQTLGVHAALEKDLAKRKKKKAAA